MPTKTHWYDISLVYVHNSQHCNRFCFQIEFNFGGYGHFNHNDICNCMNYMIYHFSNLSYHELMLMVMHKAGALVNCMIFVICITELSHTWLHWPPGCVTVISKIWFLKSSYRILVWTLTVKLLSVEYHRASLKRVNTGACNGLVPSGNNPLLEQC